MVAPPLDKSEFKRRLLAAFVDYRENNAVSNADYLKEVLTDIPQPAKVENDAGPITNEVICARDTAVLPESYFNFWRLR